MTKRITKFSVADTSSSMSAAKTFETGGGMSLTMIFILNGYQR